MAFIPPVGLECRIENPNVQYTQAPLHVSILFKMFLLARDIDLAVEVPDSACVPLPEVQLD